MTSIISIKRNFACRATYLYKNLLTFDTIQKIREYYFEENQIKITKEFENFCSMKFLNK